MHGVGTYIDAAIRSVLQQTYSCFELLLVDDGSTDDTVERCRAYLGDPRVVLICQPNRGCAAARNHGIRRSRGELIALLDGDDAWVSNKLARQIAHLEHEPRIGILHCGALLVDEGGASLGVSHHPPTETTDLVSLFRNNPICTPSAVLIRREVLAEIQYETAGGELAYFDETLECADDLECWLRVMATTSSWTIAATPEVLAHYRVRSDSNTGDIDRYPQRWRQVLARIARYAPDLVAQHGDAATARIFRYLAQRKFLSHGEASCAARLARRAVRIDPTMLWNEPFRSLLTLAATHAALFVPRAQRPALRRIGERVLSQLAHLGAVPIEPMRFGDP